MRETKRTGLLELTPSERIAVVHGTLHPGGCRCKVCRLWWRLLGPDPKTGGYGPFAAAEIEGKPRARSEAA